MLVTSEQVLQQSKAEVRRQCAGRTPGNREIRARREGKRILAGEENGVGNKIIYSDGEMIKRRGYLEQQGWKERKGLLPIQSEELQESVGVGKGQLTV